MKGQDTEQRAAGRRFVYLQPEDIRKLATFEFAPKAVVEGYLAGRHRSRARGVPWRSGAPPGVGWATESTRTPAAQHGRAGRQRVAGVVI